MSREEIIRMAREAGVFEVSYPHPAGNMVEVERFAALVASAEREACAKIVEEYCGAWDDAGYALSQAIRERGQE